MRVEAIGSKIKLFTNNTHKAPKLNTNRPSVHHLDICIGDYNQLAADTVIKDLKFNTNLALKGIASQSTNYIKYPALNTLNNKLNNFSHILSEKTMVEG